MPIFGELEGRAWPVVSEFQIRSASRGAEGVTLQGTRRKQRDCVYPGMTIHAGTFGNTGLPRERLQVTFINQPEDLSTTRLAGLQFLGAAARRAARACQRPRFADRDTPSLSCAPGHPTTHSARQGPERFRQGYRQRGRAPGGYASMTPCVRRSRSSKWMVRVKARARAIGQPSVALRT